MSHTTPRTEGAGGRGREGGFTLIEILVALAAASVLVAAVYAAFFAVFEAADSRAAGLDERIEAGRLFDRFSRDIHSTYFKADDTGARFLGARQGMGSSLRFTAFTYPIAAKGAPATDVTGVSYTATEEDGAYTVMREVWNPFIGVKAGAEVISGLESFELAYYNGRVWVKAWDSELEGRAPAAVRLTVTITGGETISSISRIMTR